jgi:hypothetical protein
MAKLALKWKAVAAALAVALLFVANPELRALLLLVNAAGADIMLVLLGIQLRAVTGEALVFASTVAALLLVAGWRLTLSFVLVRSPYALCVAHYRLTRRCSRPPSAAAELQR